MANTPFKLKSGNSPSFKQMGSSPLNQGLFERVTGTKFKDTKLGKGLTEAGTQIRSDISDIAKLSGEVLGKTNITEDLKRKKRDLLDLKTDISTGQKLGTTKAGRTEEIIEEDISEDIGENISENIEEIIPDVSSDWKTRKGDPWSYRKTEDGYQTKRGEEGDVIDVINENSRAYRAISELDIFQE